MKEKKPRPIKITPEIIKFADGSCLFEIGDTKVLVTATIQETVPPHAAASGIGWITAEYSLLPRAGKTRTPRQRIMTSGRTYEIQRIIGRTLRAIVDLSVLKNYSIIIDCDVLQADGGTRTAGINGGYIAIVYALRKMLKEGKIEKFPITEYLGAISVGIVNGKPVLDLNYEEDNIADVDMNVAMTSSGKIVEVQATAERKTFTIEELYKLISLAKKGIDKIINAEKKIIGTLG
jgi:ribonuclease PH